MSRLDNLKRLNNMVSSLLDTVEEMEKNIDSITIEDVNELKKSALSLSEKVDKKYESCELEGNNGMFLAKDLGNYGYLFKDFSDFKRIGMYDCVCSTTKKVILKSNLFGIDLTNSYSVECGFDDGKRHLDHHGKYSNNPSPCNRKNFSTKMYWEYDKNGNGSDFNNGNVYISHIDADTIIGISKLLNFSKSVRGEYNTITTKELDLNLLEQIDLNGQSVCEDKFNPTLLFHIGVGVKARELNFPRVTEEEQDVTDLIWEMLTTSTEEYIDIGRKSQEASEEAYIRCMIKHTNDSAFFIIDSHDSLNPSRAYEDGYNKVVVFRKHWKTISIYCNPKSNYAFAGQTIAGITFMGHPQACGSPRGEEMDVLQAMNVFEEVREVK